MVVTIIFFCYNLFDCAQYIYINSEKENNMMQCHHCDNCYLKKFLLNREDILNDGENAFKALIYIRDCITPTENNESYRKFYNSCIAYEKEALKNPEKFIHESCTERENEFIMEVVRKIGYLALPISFAYFFKIDEQKVIMAIELGKLPAFKYGKYYYIKTLEILPYLDKINL